MDSGVEVLVLSLALSQPHSPLSLYTLFTLTLEREEKRKIGWGRRREMVFSLLTPSYKPSIEMEG
jgi:hypothetical protein